MHNLASLSESISQSDSRTQWYDAIYRQYHSRITGYIWTLLPPRHRSDTENLAQDVFMRAWCNVEKLLALPEQEMLAWITRVAKNVVIDYCRRAKLVEWHSIEQEEMEHWLVSPLNTETQAEQRELLHECLSSVPEKSLSMLFCAMQGIRGKAVERTAAYHVERRRLIRARKACREAYEQYAQEVAS